MRRRAGFWNCDNVTAADGPGQRNRGRRATVCCADTCKRGVMHQAVAAERSIGHHRHAALLAPWQQIILNAATADVVKHLIGRAAVAVWNMEEIFHVADREVGYTPGANLTRRAQTL